MILIGKKNLSWISVRELLIGLKSELQIQNPF